MSVPTDKMRESPWALDSKGVPSYRWSLSSPAFNDSVRLVLPPMQVLPVVFVPGIMGSNLMDMQQNQVWRLDTTFGQPLGLARKMAFSGPADRQRSMHPSLTQVDPRGSVPSKPQGSVSAKTQYRTERFWGEVAESSYHAFLLWLEDKLNGQSVNPARWDDFYYTAVSAAPTPGQARPEPVLPKGIPMRMRAFEPSLHADGAAGARPVVEGITSDDLLNRARFRMPVYACGYNWLDSNTRGAERLRDRINAIIAANNRTGQSCTQVAIVTHSMGGLVARRCAILPGMEGKIAGIVHGVMPAVGAAVAYRRCKIGMRDEDFAAGLVIGSNGREVTAVFSQAPGALQLLPTAEYPANWLKVKDASGRDIETQPSSEPYESIYLRRDRWWGLIREEWLSPQGGRPLSWDQYALNIRISRSFHEQIRGQYHPVTYVYYGADSKQASFENICWKMSPGIRPDSKPAPTADDVRNMPFTKVRDDGANPLRVGGQLEITPSYGEGPGSTYQSSYWDLVALKQDGGGDGTVPTSSGGAPLRGARDRTHIRQQFRLTGFGHEPSYKDPNAQFATLYSLQKIASKAKKSA